MSLLRGQKLRDLRDTPAAVGSNRVARAIELSDVTQMDVATATGLPQPYISDVARNRYQTITVENAHKFAEFFGCAIEDLFPAREAMSA
jgi:transcriptional regulator with XRE-family HTH domain